MALAQWDTSKAPDGAAAYDVAFLDMLGVFAEFETNLRRERQLEGIAAAKLRGVARTRRAYRLDVQHFMTTLGITNVDELRQADAERETTIRHHKADLELKTDAVVDPKENLETDIGPVIDGEALTVRAAARLVALPQELVTAQS